MSTVIEIDDLWKKYRLGIIGTGTLRHDFERWWHRVRGKPDPHSKVDQRSEIRNRKSELATDVDHRISAVSASLGDDEMWALRGVSFEVEQGEILGIIGRNGAGKSTLLKILSRVTAPTSGEVRVKGRIASLLEVGTGFHPELTGRENVFLNGAILGMTKAEIRKKFNEIVDFAGVERYMDTPVKRYSSGMYVRLAFAVAAHLEAEILIVDEVLSVGDAEFQKKCIGKMKDVSFGQGRTVLFVSHQLGMVSSICSRAILLQEGKISASGETSAVVNRYLQSASTAPHIIDYRSGGRAPGDALGRLLYACIENGSGRPVEKIDIRQPFAVRMDFEILQDVPKGPHPNFHFFDNRGEHAFAAVGSNLVNGPASRGKYTSRCFVPGELLNDGLYSIGVALTFIHHGMHVSFYDRQGLSFSVVDPIDETLMTSRGGYAGPMPGPVRPNLRWETVKHP